MSDRQHIMFDALAIAMTAKCGEVSDQDLGNLMVKAEQILGSDDPVTRAITSFQVQVELQPNIDRIKELGAELHHYLGLCAQPAPIDAERRDIHG